MEDKPKTFKELFKGTGIEPKKDKDGNIVWEFKAMKKELDADKKE